LPYQVKQSITFRPNYRSLEGIEESIAAWMQVRKYHEDAAGKQLYTAIQFDETRYPLSSPNQQCQNPINDDNPGTNPATFEAGAKIFFQDMIAAFTAAVGAANYHGTTGNIWSPDLWQVQDDPGMFLNLGYIESAGGQQCDTLAELEGGPATGCGTQNAANFGALNKENAQVNLAPSNTTGAPLRFENSCRGAQLIAGRAASQIGADGNGVWLGWYAANKVIHGVKCTYLLRTIPNWDNTRGATSRSWNESTDTYSSSNSFFNDHVIYSRHRLYNTNHRMYVMRRTTTGPPTVTLNSNEKVVDARCTNTLFFPAGQCVSGYFTQSGNTVSFDSSIQNENGYILIVHRQPTLQSATVPAVDQLNVCFATDDAPAVMEPASGPTGFTIKADTVTKIPSQITRTGPACYHFEFAAGTITAATDVVTVAYSGGNVTAGTAMINTSNKVPAANFSETEATCTLCIGGGGGGATPVTTQTRYQWGHYDGPPDTAALYNLVNVQLAPSPGGLARLYIKYRNTTAAQIPTDFPLYYAINPANQTDPSLGAPLTDTCTSTNVCYSPALGVGDPTVTAERLPGDETTNVACAVIASASAVPVITLPTASETECVYSLKFGGGLAPGARVYFYPRGVGAALLDGYNTSNLPHATVAQARADTVSSGVTGGSIQ
jgi:hypothetical protein